jgi:hypothetical protein
MTLPTEMPGAVGLEGGGESHLGGGTLFAVLEIPLEWNEFCYACERPDQRFVATVTCADGLFCECAGCGDVRVVRFSRMNSEAQ